MRDGKGGKDRVTMLPRSLKPALKAQLTRARALHQGDLGEGSPKWLSRRARRRRARVRSQAVKAR